MNVAKLNLTNELLSAKTIKTGTPMRAIRSRYANVKKCDEMAGYPHINPRPRPSKIYEVGKTEQGLELESENFFCLIG